MSETVLKIVYRGGKLKVSLTGYAEYEIDENSIVGPTLIEEGFNVKRTASSTKDDFPETIVEGLRMVCERLVIMYEEGVLQQAQEEAIVAKRLALDLIEEEGIG